MSGEEEVESNTVAVWVLLLEKSGDGGVMILPFFVHTSLLALLACCARSSALVPTFVLPCMPTSFLSFLPLVRIFALSTPLSYRFFDNTLLLR